jgi:hypothetical protein
MCEPTLIISAMATAGGAYLKNQAANRANRMAGAAVGEYGQKNLALETEGRDAIDNTRQMFEQQDFGAGQGETTNRLAALFNDATNSPSKTLPIAAGAPAIIGNTMNSELANAAAFNKQQNDALANLQGFGTFLANTINPAMNRSAETGQMMGNMMGGNANVLNAQLRNAKNKANSPLGDILQTAGSIGVNYGLSAPSAGAAPANPPSVA